MNKGISVIIPNYNGEATIGKCLESAISLKYDNFEVIVVDDCSSDSSVEIIKKFPCRLIQLNKHSGASNARNTGAQNSSREILFFIDADCILHKETLALVNKTFSEDKNTVMGGTYTLIPYDNSFFSAVQSVFVNYSETKNKEPDYIATHAMVIDSELFIKNRGFPEDFLPILEDVELSHRLKRSGCKLVMNPDLLVQHVFNFTLMKSLRNAFKKSQYWTIYSLKNKDLLSDSGTASYELKTNVAFFTLNVLLIILFLFHKKLLLLAPVPIFFILNLLANKGLLISFYRAKGLSFLFSAALYYILIYPVSVAAGTFSGMLKYIWIYKFKIHRNREKTV